MLKAELLEIIANGENSGVDFKRDDLRPEQLAKTVVAMANLKGGMLLLGVEDDGHISGLQKTDAEEWAMHCIATKVHPLILPFYEEVQIDSKRVAVISFEQGTSKPYVLRHNRREDVYIRMGSTSKLATREQQARLYESGGMLHAELLPVAGTSLATLSKERLHDYLAQILNDPEIPSDDDAWIQRLTGLGYMTAGIQHQLVCTIAGLLLFGVAPRRYLRQARIRLIVFDGEYKTYRSLLDDVIDGPLVGLWRVERGQRTLAATDFGLIERLLEKITPFVSEEPDDIDAGFRRERQWHYPRAVLREAVINALAHRDWTRSVDIEIGVYANRCEIISPGALHNAMTIEKMLAGQRSPKKPAIGRGVARLRLCGCKRHGREN